MNVTTKELFNQRKESEDFLNETTACNRKVISETVHESDGVEDMNEKYVKRGFCETSVEQSFVYSATVIKICPSTVFAASAKNFCLGPKNLDYALGT